MMDVNCEGVYAKTQAYNFLKTLLGVSKKVRINKTFFNLFFKECDEMFLIRKPEDIIKRIFTEKGIAEVNKKYYLLKKNGEVDEAHRFAEQIMSTIRESLAA